MPNLIQNYEFGSLVYGAVRTPIGSFNGALSSLSAPQLAALAMKEAVDRSGFPPERVSEAIIGQVLQAGCGQAPARQVALLAGLPDEVGATTVNKVCGSGMKAVMMADQAIRLGEASFILAGGMESMSQAPHLLPRMRRGKSLGHDKIVDSLIWDGLWDSHEDGHMGSLCEKLGQSLGYDRKAQDVYAETSYRRALEAIKEGFFSDEIVPITTEKNKTEPQIGYDEEPSEEALQSLPLLQPVYDRESGTITKGNGAKIGDGAAILAIGKPFPGLVPIARILGSVCHAESPATFGMAPVGAIRKLLGKCKLRIEDVDLFEINEAFALMSLAVNDRLNLDPEKVNPNGGSIALGHPIGATGARIIVSLIHALRRKEARLGIAALCIGGGEATAIAVEII